MYDLVKVYDNSSGTKQQYNVVVSMLQMNSIGFRLQNNGVYVNLIDKEQAERCVREVTGV